MRTRPCKFTAEELEEKIQEYYSWAEDKGQKITVTGLAWWLEIDRQTLLRYEKWEELGYLKGLEVEEKRKIGLAVKRAKQYIESQYEQLLYQKGSNTGAIFTLKNNYGWVDKQEIVNADKKSIGDMTEEELNRRLEELKG